MPNLLKDSSNKNFIPQYLKEDGSDFEAVRGKDGASFVQLTGSNVQDVTLQNAATAAGNGTPFVVEGFKTLTIEIIGTSTSRTIFFEAASVSNISLPIQGVKLLDMSVGSSTTGNNELWQFDVTGLVSFRARLSSVAGGNVSIKGKAVA